MKPQVAESESIDVAPRRDQDVRANTGGSNGAPADGYPYRWAVHRWIPGEGAALDRVDDPVTFALDLGEVIRKLQAVPTDGAPSARGRARPLHEYDESTRRAIEGASHLIDAMAAIEVWEEALAAPPYDRPPVWVHGDLEGNRLVRDRRLCGIVDWGSARAGDPAVDVRRGRRGCAGRGGGGVAATGRPVGDRRTAGGRGSGRGRARAE